MGQGEEDNVDDKDELIGIKGDPAIFDFNEKEGMKVDIPENASPLQIFFLLFNIALIDKLFIGRTPGHFSYKKWLRRKIICK